MQLSWIGWGVESAAGMEWLMIRLQSAVSVNSWEIYRMQLVLVSWEVCRVELSLGRRLIAMTAFCFVFRPMAKSIMPVVGGRTW